MKFLSFNVNGIRASHKKGVLDQVFNLDYDIIGIQETKSTPEQLSEAILKPVGYISYFDSSKTRKGYSGVAIYTKHEPLSIHYGLGDELFDTEGRCLTLIFKDFVFITAYFPNGGRDADHFEFKLKYYDRFLEYVNHIKKKHKNIIFCGDLNVAHREIDIARPKENANQIGFLPIERGWVDRLIHEGYVDTFRNTNPDTVLYSWWDQKSGARARNVGWRIDYFFVSPNLKDKYRDPGILTSFMGSDHAPICLTVDL